MVRYRGRAATRELGAHVSMGKKVPAGKSPCGNDYYSGWPTARHELEHLEEVGDPFVRMPSRGLDESGAHANTHPERHTNCTAVAEEKCQDSCTLRDMVPEDEPVLIRGPCCPSSKRASGHHGAGQIPARPRVTGGAGRCEGIADANRHPHREQRCVQGAKRL